MLSLCLSVVKVIGLFDRGQAWEHGIPLCKELCTLYDTEIQYNELAATLVSHPLITMVMLFITYNSIATRGRVLPEDSARGES